MQCDGDGCSYCIIISIPSDLLPFHLHYPLRDPKNLPQNIAPNTTSGSRVQESALVSHHFIFLIACPQRLNCVPALTFLTPSKASQLSAPLGGSQQLLI